MVFFAGKQLAQDHAELLAAILRGSSKLPAEIKTIRNLETQLGAMRSQLQLERQKRQQAENELTQLEGATSRCWRCARHGRSRVVQPPLSGVGPPRPFYAATTGTSKDVLRRPRWTA